MKRRPIEYIILFMGHVYIIFVDTFILIYNNIIMVHMLDSKFPNEINV